MKKIRIMLFSMLLIMVPAVVSAEGWSKLYGGIYYVASTIQQSVNDGFVVAGQAYREGSSYLWVLTIDNDGNVVWQKTYGGSVREIARSIQQTFDGGYIVAGRSYSFGPDTVNVWILKLDAEGNIQWQKTYGTDYANSIEQTADGGYIVAGTTSSSGTGHSNIWILKLDKDGNTLWQKIYGSSIKGLEGRVIRLTSDGGYIVAGDAATGFQLVSSANESAQSGKDNGPDGALVLKLDSNGDIQWQKVYDSVGITNDLHQTSDGGYIVAGHTFSYGSGSRDAWIFKLNSQGEIQWQKVYGSDYSDSAHSVQQMSDGGFIVGGEIYFNSSAAAAWLWKIDEDGNIQWQRSYGFPAESALTVNPIADGGYIVAGSSGWVARVDEQGNIDDCSIVNTASAVSVDSTAGAYDTDLTVQNSSAVPQDTNAVVTDLDSLPTGVCISANMQPPSSQNTYSYLPVLYPSLNADPMFAEPVGVGTIAYDFLAPGSKSVILNINLLPFTGPVDIYGAFTLSSNPEILRVLNPDLSFQSVSFNEIAQSLKEGSLPEGIVPWKKNTLGPISEDLFEKMSLFSGIPSGTYTIYLLVTPTGRLDSYYLWKTYFVVP